VSVTTIYRPTTGYNVMISVLRKISHFIDQPIADQPFLTVTLDQLSDQLSSADSTDPHIAGLTCGTTV